MSDVSGLGVSKLISCTPISIETTKEFLKNLDNKSDEDSSISAQCLGPCTKSKFSMSDKILYDDFEEIDNKNWIYNKHKQYIDVYLIIFYTVLFKFILFSISKLIINMSVCPSG